MMQLIIYLPLMDDVQILEALRRIEGNIFGRESYVLDKLRYLLNHIPDSKAKRYADYEAAKCTYEYFTEYHTHEITEAEKIWLDPERSEEMYSCYEEYIALIEKKKAAAEAVATLQDK